MDFTVIYLPIIYIIVYIYIWYHMGYKKLMDSLTIAHGNGQVIGYYQKVPHKNIRDSWIDSSNVDLPLVGNILLLYGYFKG